MTEYYGAEIMPGKVLGTSEIEIIKSENPVDKLGSGVEGDIIRVTVIKEGFEVVMAFKAFKHFDISTPENNLMIRDILENIDVPTFSQYILVIQDNKSIGILMEDLTEGGKNFVFTSNDMEFLYYKVKNLVSTDPALAKIISEIPESLMQNWSDKFKGYAQRSTEAGLEFTAFDLIFWIITPSGQIKATFGDLGSIHWIKNPDLQNNLNRLEDGIGNLRRLRELCYQVLQSNKL